MIFHEWKEQGSGTMNHVIEQKIQSVYALDRARCKAELLGMARPRLDFTEEYLDALNLDRLRHLLVAAYLQAAKPRRV